MSTFNAKKMGAKCKKIAQNQYKIPKNRDLFNKLYDFEIL